MCEMIAQKTGCTVAEPLWYASHPFAHLGQTGTVPIPDDLTSAMVRSIVSGYWNAGFRKQILMSSHGQEYIIPSAIQEWAKKYQVPAVIIFLDVMKIMGDALKDKVDEIEAEQIAHSRAAAVFARCFDLDIHGPDGENFGMDERHDRARVVHRRTSVANGAVELVEKLQPLRNDIADRISECAHALKILRHDQRLFRHVQSRHCDGDA